MEKLYSLPDEIKHQINDSPDSFDKKDIDLNLPLSLDGLDKVEESDRIRNWPQGDLLPTKDLDEPLYESLDRFDPLKETLDMPKEDPLNPEELDTPLFEQKDPEITGLTPGQKEELKSKTGWSDEIIDYIKTEEEAQVYVEANLKEVNGNLERTDIDWNAKIPQDRIDRMRSLYGDEVADKWADKTNLDLIKEGKAPYGPDGQQVNLHHIGQKSDSPLAELTNTEHKQNDGVLHEKNRSSEIERPVFRVERQQYWMARYESLTKQN